MKFIDYLLEPLTRLADSWFRADEMAVQLRALGWDESDMDGLRMFAQIGGTGEDLGSMSAAMQAGMVSWDDVRGAA